MQLCLHPFLPLLPPTWHPVSVSHTGQLKPNSGLVSLAGTEGHLHQLGGKVCFSALVSPSRWAKLSPSGLKTIGIVKFEGDKPLGISYCSLPVIGGGYKKERGKFLAEPVIVG